MRVRLLNEQIVEVTPGECHVGGFNWPLCALGVTPHRECVERWLTGDLQAERPVDSAKTFWPFRRPEQEGR